MDKDQEAYAEWRKLIETWNYWSSQTEIWAQDRKWDSIWGSLEIIKNHITNLQHAIGEVTKQNLHTPLDEKNATSTDT